MPKSQKPPAPDKGGRKPTRGNRSRRRPDKPTPEELRAQRLEKIARVAELHFGRSHPLAETSVAPMPLRMVAWTMGLDEEEVEELLAEYNSAGEAAMKKHAGLYKEHLVMELMATINKLRPEVHACDFGSSPDHGAGGSGQAAAAYLKAIEQLAKIVGAYQPTKVEVAPKPTKPLADGVVKAKAIASHVFMTVNHAASRA